MTIQEAPTFIYVLYDEKDPTHIRYVGKTKNKLKYRLQQHIVSRKKTYKTMWIRSTIKSGNKICIKVIEECNENTWKEREKYWIKYYKEANHRLTNLTDGGESSSICGDKHPGFNKIGSKSWNFGKGRKDWSSVEVPTKPGNKPVAMIDPITHDTVKVFSSPAIAAHSLKCSRLSIAKIARGKSRQKTYYGFIWKYL